MRKWIKKSISLTSGDKVEQQTETACAEAPYLNFCVSYCRLALSLLLRVPISVLRALLE